MIAKEKRRKLPLMERGACGALWKQLAFYQRYTGGVILTYFWVSCEDVTDLCQHHAANHISNYMLPCGQGRYAHCHGHDKGEMPIKHRNILSLSDPNPAKPTNETVNGRKQVVGSIDAIEQFHQHVPHRISNNFRTDVGGRN